MAGGPIFVVGAPRTGTTLVKEILNRHPRIHLFDEVHFFERIWDDRENLGNMANPTCQAEAMERLRAVVREYGTDQKVAEVLTPEVFRRKLEVEGGGYRGLLAALLKTGAELRGADFWGDSSPQDVLYLPTIFEWFPNVRVVATVRDPRGVLSSYKNYHRRGIPSYRERYNPLMNAVLWRSYMSALLEARRRVWTKSVHRVSYEELVASPETVVRGICAHVGVTYETDMLDVTRTNTSFVESDATREEDSVGISASSRDRWRTELSRTEIWVGERVFGGIMRELGYEPFRNGIMIPSPFELARILAILPGRLFNMLFHSSKPFRLTKVRRVLSFLRPH